MRRLVENALSNGAQTSGGDFDIYGATAQPLVFNNVTRELNIYHQESFGPLVTHFEFETPVEVVRLANDAEYGLVSSVYGENILETRFELGTDD